VRRHLCGDKENGRALLNGVLDVFLQNILPIFLVAGLGFWLRRGLKLSVKPLSSVVFNAFSPCLVFSALVGSQLPAGELTDLALFALLSILFMALVAWLAGRILRFSRVKTVTLMIVVMFVNGGNFGLTLNQLRYGEAGLSRAVVYFVVSTALVYTVGVFIASAGRLSLRDALRRLARIPPLYAVVLALLVYGFQVTVPAPLMSAIDIAAAGAIPVMIVILGMQLADLRDFSALRFAGLAAFLRLIVAPVAAVGLAALIGLQGLNRSTAIIEASMPTAVITTVIATEFELSGPVVTSVVAITTILSPLTLSLVIQLLGL